MTKTITKTKTTSTTTTKAKKEFDPLCRKTSKNIFFFTLYLQFEDNIDNFKNCIKHTNMDKTISYLKFIPETFIKKGSNNNEYKELVYQAEICPKTKKLHFQGCFKANFKTTWPNIKNTMFANCPTIHLELCKDWMSSVTYCSKIDTYDTNTNIRIKDVEDETTKSIKKKNQGSRQDIKVVINDIKNGSKLHDIMIKYPSQYNKYHKLIKDSCFFYAKKRIVPPKLIIRFGEPGTGKSESWIKLQMENEQNIYKLDFKDCPGTIWFDGYYQQKYLIFEEFKPARMDICTLLTFIDGGEKHLEVKGGTTQLNSEYIIITSNLHPLDWYNKATPLHRLALLRRISQYGQVFYHSIGNAPEDITHEFIKLFNSFRSPTVDQSAAKRQKMLNKFKNYYINDELDNNEYQFMDVEEKLSNNIIDCFYD